MSQLKYNVPLKCRKEAVNEYREMHETMEVVTFCEKRGTTLNTRVVQVSAFVAFYEIYFLSATNIKYVRENRFLSITQNWLISKKN